MADITLRILGQEPLPLSLGSDNSETLSVGSGVTEGRLQEVLQDYVPKADIDDTLSIEGDVAEAKATGDAIAEINAKLADILPSDSASGAIASFPDGAKDFPLKSLEVDIEPKQSGSGTPAPDNVRPITGFSSVNVVRTGKNLIRLSADNYNEGQQATPEYTDSGLIITATGIYGRVGYVIHDIKAGQTYTFSLRGSSTGDFNNVYLNNNTPWGSGTDRYATIKLGTAGDKSATFTAIDETLYIGFYVTARGTSGMMNISNIQLELGSSATPYSPYTGQSYTIPLPSTVYGGKIKDGVLTVDRARVNLGSFSWNYNSGLPKFPFRSTTALSDAVLPPNNQTVPDAICEAFEIKQYASDTGVTTWGTIIWEGSASEGQIWVQDTTHTSSTSFQNDMNGKYLVYKLATPTTIPLTPTEIKTLLGDNNIFADSGDVSVVYSADIAKYIDKRLS